MQLSPSADLLIPVGVGVLVAAVAVIALVIGLRRRTDEAPAPSHDDWTGEHVGEVVAPKTRTVADAVAARQGNTNPFFLGSPERPGVAGAADPGTAAPARSAEGNGAGRGPALPPSALGSAVSTSAQRARPRHAVQWAARALSVARAEPAGVVGPVPTAVSGVGPVDDDGPTYPSDPLRGAGRSDEFPEQRSGTAVPPAPAGGTGQEQSRGHRPADGSSESTPGGARPADDRPAAGKDESASTGAGPSAVRPPAAGAAGSAPMGLPGLQSAAGEGGSAPTGAGVSGVRPPVGGAAGSAPAGFSADGHPAAGGGESRPAGLSADGHPVAGDGESAARSADDHTGGAGAAGTGSAATGHPPAEGTEPGPAAGSSHSVAAAVAQVLAARAAAQAPEGDRRGDARDRLLAVLLDDPLRAVGAAVDLQECRERLDRLTASLKDEHGRLGDVLGRLACSGLRPDQLARLSGLSDVEVAELLRRRKAD
jgi:hypothetical protein